MALFRQQTGARSETIVEGRKMGDTIFFAIPLGLALGLGSVLGLMAALAL